ncbi:MAG: DsbA family protein [Phycisphaerales bacterium]
MKPKHRKLPPGPHTRGAEPLPAAQPVIFACLALALLASGALALAHLMAEGLPGCGRGGGCDAAAASALGRAPLLGWPMSIVGTAYFLGLLVAGVLGRGVLSRGIARVALMGAAWSLVMLGGLIQIGHVCVYCLIVHGANLVTASLLIRRFSVLPERSPRRQVAVALALGVASLAGLLVADRQAASRAQAKAERRLAESTAAMTGQQRAPASAGFEGRFPRGPKEAVARIVVFTDYQCPDCRMVDAQIEDLAADPRVSVSVKLFPLNEDCNPNAPGQYHANACWAARAAEAAGKLGGAEGFWRMHRWLFGRGGAFTEAELRAALPGLGFEPAMFSRLMESPEAIRGVEADVREGVSLGISQTPMIFINGVELRGWNAPGGVTRAVRAVLDSSPAPATSSADSPQDAIARYMADWRASPAVVLPPAVLRNGLGRETAPVTVVLIGDYREKTCAEADGLLRVFTSGAEPTIRYHFVHFPVEAACNPATTLTRHPGACLAARAVEAAAGVDGQEGFWRMHDWLMRNQDLPLDEPALRQAAAEVALDPDLFMEALAQPFTSENVAADAAAAKSLDITSIPMIFVNGRHAPRWKYQAENLLGRMIMEAAGQ